jgi:hypothetical protein
MMAREKIPQFVIPAQAGLRRPKAGANICESKWPEGRAERVIQ